MGSRDDREAWSREGSPLEAMHKANQQRIQKLPDPPTWRPRLGDVAKADSFLAELDAKRIAHGKELLEKTARLEGESPSQSARSRLVTRLAGESREVIERVGDPVLRREIYEHQEAARTPRVRRSRGITP